MIENKLNREVFGERLKEILYENNVSPEELSKIIKISPSSLSRYISGKMSPKITTIQVISDVFGINPVWLMGYDVEKYSDKKEVVEVTNLYKSLNTYNRQESINYMKYLKNKQDNDTEMSSELFIMQKRVKILGQTAAGQPLEYGDSITEDINNLSDIPANANFALTVKGDSMEPLIKNGSIVYIHSQEDVENGTISIVEIDGAVTCKKVYKEDNQLKLVSINEKYEPMLIDKGNVRILGKVIL